MPLPRPSEDALAASHALQDRIADAIAQAGGWIGFAPFMDLALYAPGLGYYSGGATKLGKDGDFTTAPEISPLFGAALARLAAGLMAQSAPRVLEFGAGTGRLAFDFLSECARAGAAVERYTIVEVSGQLRARQQTLLRDFPQVAWVDRLPDAFSGVVLGNEVLDAMPVRLVRKTGTGWNEVGVALADGAGQARVAGAAGRADDPLAAAAAGPAYDPRGVADARGASGRFAFAERPCAPDLLEQIGLQIDGAQDLDPGYLTEVHTVACGFMRSLAALLAAGKGAAILPDYGFPGHEYYHPQRDQGTLMCHYRHHAHPDPFYLPGLQDITAHVDFTAMARAALAGGAEVLTYTSQAHFLMAAGIADLLLRTDPADARAYLPQANAVQKLVSPAEMGELFKVLVVGHGVRLPAAFDRGDRTHRL